MAEQKDFSVCLCCGFHGCAECVVRHQASCQPSVNHILAKMLPDDRHAVEDAVRHMGCADYKREFRQIVEQQTIGDLVSMLGKNRGIPMKFGKSERNPMSRYNERQAVLRCRELNQTYRNCYIPPNNGHAIYPVSYTHLTLPTILRV